MSKKITIFVIGLFLLSLLGIIGSLNLSIAQAATYTFSEDFSATTHKDAINTTADWNTVEKKVTLSPYYTVNDWSSYFKNFNGPVTAVANNNYTQMIGGGNGSLNLIPSENFSSFEDISSQLIGFAGININAVAQSIPSGYAYSLVGGGIDNGSGGGTGPKLNKLESSGYSTQTGTLWKVTNLSPDLVALKFNSVSDIACNNNECLIIGTPALGTATARLVKYNGTTFTDLSSNIDFNTTSRDRVVWNGSYWLIAGTRYYPPESSDYIGKIYEYDGSTFSKITTDTMFVGQGPSIFDMAWNGNEWLIARGYGPVKLYKYNGSTFQDLSSQLNKFIFASEIATPTIYWTGKAWLIGGGNYFKHLIRFDGTNMADVIGLLKNFGDSGINVIESKFSTAYNDFLIGGGLTIPVFNSVQELGYKTSAIVQSKKINTAVGTIDRAILTVVDQRPQTTTGVGTSITYFLSADGGANWEQVTPGPENVHIFSHSGSDLRWEAVLSSTDNSVTPRISNVNISYISYETAAASIAVTSPNGGESWKVGETHRISWVSTGIRNFTMYLYDNRISGSGAIVNYLVPDNQPVSAEQGYYDWTILPNVLQANDGKNFQIIIQDANNYQLSDKSDASFSIVVAGTPSITVLSPNGGESWQVGGTYTVKWNSSGVSAVNIYSTCNTVTNDHSRYYDIALNIPASNGFYNWNIDPTVFPDSQCKIQITNAYNTTTNDTNDNYFSIVAAGISVSEQVKCVFKGSQTEQKCYLAANNENPSCSGKETCVIDVTGTKGENMTWKSSCGGYAYTIMDGQNDYAEFDCTAAIIDMNNAAKDIVDNKYDSILSELKQLRDTVKEQQNEIKYLKSMTNDLKDLSDKMKSAINDFITYGVDANTVKLGAGERAAVINSYKAAFAKLPETEAELTDAIKIANGRFPSLISDKAEKEAKDQFIKIYKRIPDLNDSKDNAAIKVMAYGLRQKAENRNLNSEKAGIKTFKNIYGYTPKTTADWNNMQAITYSGAAREQDSDGDLLSDEMEAQYGTDPNKADTDGDGFKDGAEVLSGYNPNGAGKL